MQHTYIEHCNFGLGKTPLALNFNFIAIKGPAPPFKHLIDFVFLPIASKGVCFLIVLLNRDGHIIFLCCLTFIFWSHQIESSEILTSQTHNHFFLYRRRLHELPLACTQWETQGHVQWKFSSSQEQELDLCQNQVQICVSHNWHWLN